MFSSSLVRTLTVIVVAVILFSTIFFGLNSGKTLSQSNLIVANTETVIRGLDFFYKDQERFPSPSEFNNTEVMSDYLSPFPPVAFSSPGCEKSLSYTATGPSSYQLEFCLPVATSGFVAGWNKYSAQK